MKPSVMDNAKVWVSAAQLEMWLAPVFSRLEELEGDIQAAWTRYNNALRASDRTYVLYGCYPSTPSVIKDGSNLIKAAKAANDGLIFLPASDAKQIECAGSFTVDVYLEGIKLSAEFLEKHPARKTIDLGEDATDQPSNNRSSVNQKQAGDDRATRGTDPLVIGAILFVCAMFFVMVFGMGR